MEFHHPINPTEVHVILFDDQPPITFALSSPLILYIPFSTPPQTNELYVHESVLFIPHPINHLHKLYISFDDHHAIVESIDQFMILLLPPAIKFPMTCKGALGQVVPIPTYHDGMIFRNAAPFNPR